MSVAVSQHKNFIGGEWVESAGGETMGAESRLRVAGDQRSTRHHGPLVNSQGRFVPEPWPVVPPLEEEVPVPVRAMPKAA